MRFARALLTTAFFAAALFPGSEAEAQDRALEIVASETGNVGAWLVRTPISQSDATLRSIPAGVDENSLAGIGANKVFASAEGALGLRKAGGKGTEIAYAVIRISVGEAGRYWGVFGSDGGLAVLVDGKTIYARDLARSFHSDDDVVPLDLDRGEHTLVLKLRSPNTGSWAFHGRITGDDLRRSAKLTFRLPTPEAPESVAARLLSVKVERGIGRTNIRPSIQFRYPEGSVRGVSGSAHATLDQSGREIASGDIGLATEGDIPLGTFEGSTLEALERSGARARVNAFGKNFDFSLAPRKATLDALTHGSEALEKAASLPDLLPGTVPSLAHLHDRLFRWASRDDHELDALDFEEKELEELSQSLLKGKDPYRERTGPMRRAFVSPSDSERSEYALYVPPSFKRSEQKSYPLIVVLHGLNGLPMAALSHFFGFDDESKGNDWEDRRMPKLPPLDAIVLAPSGRGNSMYRFFGEDDVLAAIAEVRKLYPVDETRISVTGPSMGGAGTALIALRHPDLFASAAPLCGYHSYFLRNDMQKKPIRTWERFLAEERSNVRWAENGLSIPMLVVHGTRDLPVANSGVLIDRYLELGYSMEHEHPDVGHNVWGPTYGNLKGAKWLLRSKKVLAPKRVHLKTALLRDGDNAWLHITAFEKPSTWAEADAEATSATEARLRTTGVQELTLGRGTTQSALGDTSRVRISVDATPLEFEKGERIVIHREGSQWKKGRLPIAFVTKNAAVSGPFREVFHHPVLFVYGVDDPKEARANEEVARAWAKQRFGVNVRYGVMSDAEFIAKRERLSEDRALFLVGNARTNRVLRSLEHPAFPFRVEGNAVVSRTGERFTGSEVGVAFTFPNPQNSMRPIAVIEGVDIAGTMRSLSLPELLPDFTVYDQSVASARGEQVLGPASVIAAGFFENDWSLPKNVRDPLRAR